MLFRVIVVWFWGGVKKCLPQIKTGHLIKPETGVRVLLAHIYTGRHVLSAKQCKAGLKPQRVKRHRHWLRPTAANGYISQPVQPKFN